MNTTSNYQHEQSRILAAIKLYQSKHNGLTPPFHVIARETELQPYIVRQHIGRMEERGTLFVASKYPLQIIFPKGEEAVIEQEERKEEKMNSVPSAPSEETTGQREIKPIDVRRREIAKAITEFRKEHDRWPKVTEIEDAVYGKRTGQGSRILATMAQEGLVAHRPRSQKGVYLTTLGREKLLGETKRSGLETPEERAERMRAMVRKRWERTTPEERKAHSQRMNAVRDKNRKRGANRVPTKPFFERAKEFAKAIDEGATGINALRLKVYGTDRHGGASYILKKMAEEEWVEHEPRRRNDLKLTELGRIVLLGGAVPVQTKSELSDEAREEVKSHEDAIMPELQKLEETGSFDPGKALEEAVYGVPPRTQEKDAQEQEGQFLRETGWWERPKDVPKRTEEPDNIMVPVNPRDIVRSLSDLDLVIELNARGYRVTRQ